MARPRIIDAYRGLASLLRAGLVLGDATSQLHRNGTLPGRIGSVVAAEVARGQPLSAALARFPDEFPAEDIALVEAGEATGTLDRSLERLASLHAARRAARRRLVTDSLYPLVLIHLAALLTPLPAAFAGGRLDGGLWLGRALLVLGPLYAIAGTWWWMRRSARGRAILRRVVDRLPGFGLAARCQRRADLAEVLGAAYEAGVHLDRALELAGRSAGEPRAVSAAKDVAAGRTLFDALSAAGVLPVPMLARIHTAERAGELSETLAHIATEEADAAEQIHRRSVQVLGKAIYIGAAIWILVYCVSTILGIYGPYL